MKVAICISGYFNSSRDKTSKGKDGFKHLKKHVLNKVDADVYIHSWDLENKKKIIDLYENNLKGFLFEEQINFSPFATIPHENGYVPQSAIFSQLYSVQKSFELMEMTKTKYDCVIKTRFDVGRINRLTSGPGKSNPFAVQCINFSSNYDMQNFYIADWQYLESEGPADMWFYSNYQNMKHFSKIYDIIKEDMKLGSEMELWAGKEAGGMINVIKAYKWFLLKNDLWKLIKPLETKWE
jgi:glycerophosphoryl diester phosphodiesterase